MGNAFLNLGPLPNFIVIIHKQAASCFLGNEFQGFSGIVKDILTAGLGTAPGYAVNRWLPFDGTSFLGIQSAGDRYQSFGVRCLGFLKMSMAFLSMIIVHVIGSATTQVMGVIRAVP
jgi:hypothetical protein